MFIDTHAHIYKEYYDDINFVIDNAKKDDVKYIINNGCDNESNQEVLSYLTYDNLYAALGIHPENVLEYKEKDLEYIEKNLSNPKVLAIGEIGLDYHYGKENKKEQIELLEYQLKIAEKYNMPVIIHSRDATQDTINILKQYKVTGVIHSFSGSLEVANIFIKMGYKLGINGVVTFKNSNLKDVIDKIPLNSIVLETDSPYLTPHPYRGTKNEPKYIKIIAECICEIKHITMEELSQITNENIKEIFPKIDILP